MDPVTQVQILDETDWIPHSTKIPLSDNTLTLLIKQEKLIQIFSLYYKKKFQWLEHSSKAQETGVQSQVEWYLRLKKWFLKPSCSQY